MARSNDFTHGGSVGKNLVLLLRAIVNVIAFFALGYCIANGINIAVTLSSATLLVLCVWFNLVYPWIHRKKY